MQTLPYKSEVKIVSKDMCDHNGHMNVNYYYQLFDMFILKCITENLGFDDAYLASGFSTFTLEDSIRYLKEFKLNDKVYPSFYLANVNKNFFILWAFFKMSNGELSAIFETVLAHMDLNAER